MIDQTINDFTTHLLEIVIYAVGIGLTVKVLASLWRDFWHIEIDRREQVVLSAGTSAFVAVFLIDRGPWIVISTAAVIIGGAFLIRLITKYIDREK